MNRTLENLPGFIGVFGIHDDAVLERLNLEIPLLLITHNSKTPSDKIDKSKPESAQPQPKSIAKSI